MLFIDDVIIDVFGSWIYVEHRMFHSLIHRGRAQFCAPKHGFEAKAQSPLQRRN